jgi:hypothetical protein
MIEVVWLLIAAGIGFGSSWFSHQKPALAETPMTPSESATTELAIALEELQQAQAAYHLAAEMSQFKAGFLARTSHELRSPLSRIIGIHQLILSNLCDSPEEEREFLTQANQSILKMVELLDQIIEISKLEHGTSKLDIQPVSLAQLLTQVEKATYLQAANRNLSLQIYLPNPDFYVLASPLHLQQVLIYLVSAAIAQLSEGAIQLSCQPDESAGFVYTWLDDTHPDAAWSEATKFTDAVPDGKEIVLSSGLNLILSQALTQFMNGELQPVALPSNTLFTRRLQLSLPLATE